MDDDVETPENRDESGSAPEEAPGPSGRLIERLAQLHSQLEILAQDERRRDAAEVIGQAGERIAALEDMLTWARQREDELTARAVRDRTRLAQLESSVADLRAAAARASDAEAALAKADANATEWRELMALAQTELEAQHAEVERLSRRCAELEADLRRVADEVADAAVARAEAERMERERDVARERARTERRLALEDRLRAAEAEGRVARLQRRLSETESRMRELTGSDAPGWEEPEAADDVAEDQAEAQRTQAMEEEASASDQADDSGEDATVIDLTEGLSASSERSAVPYERADVIVWTSPPKPTILERIRRGLQGIDDEADDDPVD